MMLHQNGIVQMLFAALTAGSPMQVVQTFLSRGMLNQQQADMLTQAITSNPEGAVRNMLSNGQMSQEQFAELSSIAHQFEHTLK